MDEWMNVWMYGRTYGRTGGRADERTNERTNEWMNFITYIPPVKPEGPIQVIFFGGRWMVINPVKRWQSSKGCEQLFHFSWSANLAYSGASSHSDFCCFSQRALHGVHSSCSHRSVVRWGEHCDTRVCARACVRACVCVCVLFVFVSGRSEAGTRFTEYAE